MNEPQYFLRLNDPFSPVYEVDFVAKTWRLAASAVGALGERKSLQDDGAVFRDEERFARVWKKDEDGDIATFTRDAPDGWVA